MRLLLHICCTPCATYPYKVLKDRFEITGFFNNPNIHPYLEYRKRLETLREYVEQVNLKLICKNEYDLEGFLRGVVFREEERCHFCYDLRLRETVKLAKEKGYDYFTTTLLVSPYQKHDLIKVMGKSKEAEYGVKFYYEDWRTGWLESRRLAREFGLYRQKYCGCIYSEKERYLKNKKLKDKGS